jgi:hypothetical protein
MNKGFPLGNTIEELRGEVLLSGLGDREFHPFDEAGVARKGIDITEIDQIAIGAFSEIHWGEFRLKFF